MPNRNVHITTSSGFISSITSIGLHLAQFSLFCQIDLTAVAGRRRETTYVFNELSGWLLLPNQTSITYPDLKKQLLNMEFSNTFLTEPLLGQISHKIKP